MTYDLIEPSELDVELSFQQPAFPEPTADDLAYLESDHQRRYNPHLQDPNNPIRRRIIIERAIVRRAVTDLIAAGYVLRVYYGDDNWGTAFTNDIGTLMAAVGATLLTGIACCVAVLLGVNALPALAGTAALFCVVTTWGGTR